MTYEKDLSGYKYRHKYDSNRNKIYTIDNTKLETWYEYDDAGNMIRFYDSDGYESQYEYDASNRLIHMVENRFDIEEWYEYDDAGNMIHRRASNGLEEFIEYNDNGKITHYRNNIGDEYFNKYNSDGRLIHYMSTNQGVSEKAYLYEYDTDADCIPIDFIKVSSGVFKCEYRFKKGTHCELKINFSSDGNIQLVSSSGDIISTPESLTELAKVLTDLDKGALR